jgi:hypothetical protein
MQDTQQVVKKLPGRSQMIFGVVTPNNFNPLVFRFPVGMQGRIVNCDTMPLLDQENRQLLGKLLKSPVLVGYAPGSQDGNMHHAQK